MKSIMCFMNYGIFFIENRNEILVIVVGVFFVVLFVVFFLLGGLVRR